MRIGIELTSAACRIVELEAGGLRRREGPTKVVSYQSWERESHAIGSPETAARLARYRGRRASVVLWNVHADHRQVAVRQGSYERMRLEAVARLRDSGAPIEGTMLDIAPGVRVPGSEDPLVVLASAPAAEVYAALAPLTAAGIRVHSALTPAAALQSLARLRCAGAGAPRAGALEAVVALEERATCIAVIRRGTLIAALDLQWGFLDELSEVHVPRRRRDVAVRLADELSGLAVRGRFGEPLAQVSVCGGMPELRGMAMQLMELLDVEVEPLDSLFGIDADRLPHPADKFHDAVAGMRVAWAAAANERPALDLLRHRRRQATKANLSRAAVVAGAAAGLSVGWWMQRQWPAPHVHTRIAAAVRPAAPATAERIAPEAPVALLAMANISPLSTPALFDAPALAERKPDVAPPVAGTTPRPWEKVPPLTPVPHVAVAAAPRAEPSIAPRPAPNVSQRQAVAERATPPRKSEVSIPLDAALQTILTGPDRSFAIVDGRIVQVGDEVHGARIEDIGANAVFLRDAQGKLRRLSMAEH